MELIHVDSTAVTRVGYTEGNLFVEFVGGRWYKYLGVLETVFKQLLAAPSIGTFVNQQIKPHYEWVPCINPPF